MKRSYLPIVLVITIALLVSVLVLNTTKEDFSSYNTDWNGASRVQALAESQGYRTRDIFALQEAGSSGRGVLIMLNPSKAVAFTSEDALDLQNFFQNGGSLILANDFGNGNAVLSGLGVLDSVRFNGSLLSDNVSKGIDATHPVVTDVIGSGFTAGVNTLYFNYGTALDIAGSNVTPLARSAPTSYLSTSSDNSAPINGSTGAKTVLASLAYGKGSIILLSDPSVFINGMLDKVDNQKLFTSVIANLTGGDTSAPILFDESHRASPPPWSLLYDRINADDNIKYTIILLSIAAFVIGMRAITPTRRRRAPLGPGEVPLDEKAVIGHIGRAHPQWRRSLIKGFLRQLQAQQRRMHGNRKPR